MPDVPAALAEVRRVLKPGGKYVFIEVGQRLGGATAAHTAVASTIYIILNPDCLKGSRAALWGRQSTPELAMPTGMFAEKSSASTSNVPADSASCRRRSTWQPRQAPSSARCRPCSTRCRSPSLMVRRHPHPPSAPSPSRGICPVSPWDLKPAAPQVCLHLNPSAPAFTGCHLTRDTAASIQSANFQQVKAPPLPHQTSRPSFPKLTA